MKNVIERINIRVDEREERISERQNRNFEVTQFEVGEKRKKKRMNKSERSLHGPRDHQNPQTSVSLKFQKGKRQEGGRKPI